MKIARTTRNRFQPIRICLIGKSHRLSESQFLISRNLIEITDTRFVIRIMTRKNDGL